MKFAIIVTLLLCYIVFENIYIFVTRIDCRIKDIPCALKNCSAVLISDLHINKSIRSAMKVVSKTKKLDPQLILISGDFISRHIKNLDGAQKVMSELCKIAPVYVCMGNHELDISEELFSDYKKMLKNCSAILLDNESAAISDGVFISGITCMNECYKNQNGGYSNLRGYTVDDINRALGKKKGFTILLAHNPLFFEAYEKWGADLVLSGHVHGGCVRIPFVCGLLSPERKLFPKYSSGFYKKNNCIMFVTRGIAKFRIFSPKHIVFLNFKNE